MSPWIYGDISKCISGRWHPEEDCYIGTAFIIGFLRMPFPFGLAFRACPPYGRAYTATSFQTS